MIRTDWLFKKQGHSTRNNDFLKFIDHLDKTNNESLYTTTFVESLLNPVWSLQNHVI